MPIDVDDFLAEGRAFAEAMRASKRIGNGSHPYASPGDTFAGLFSPVPEGTRNTSLTRLVGYLRAKRVDYPAGLFIVRQWNREFCLPPLCDDEVEGLAARAWQEWTEGDLPDATPDDFRPKPAASIVGERVALKDRIIHFKDIPFPPAEKPYLWGAFLNRGAVHWMTARTGLGKSTLTYNVACALAEGRSLWGVECEPTKTLYVDMESGTVGRSLKVQRLYLDKRPDIPLDFADVINLPTESNDLLALVKENGYELVIFDTARRCFSIRDENDNAEFYNKIAPTLDALKRMSVASLTLGHPPKNGALSARGASAQEDAGDVNLTLTLHKGEITDADAIIKLSITKNRLLGLEHGPLYLQRTGEDQFRRVEENDLPASDREEDSLVRNAVKVRSAINALLARGEKDTIRNIAAEAKISTRDVISAKKYLETEGV